MSERKPSTAVARRKSASLTNVDELTVEDLVAQVVKIQEVMKTVMKEGVHYGVIPGTDKPTLLKPGAEKLVFTFRLAPTYEILSSVEQENFLSFTVGCTLTHIPSGQVIAEGIGSCNSKENKYRWRSKKRELKPDKEEADRLKEEGKGYWRKDYNGAWAWFDRTENDNVWELQNTLMKMAAKRALVAACLNGTAASDIFAQDLEDMVLDVETEDAVVVASEELITELQAVMMVAASHAPDLWGEEVVLANARRAFKRNEIGKLEDLSAVEAQQIIDGAQKWIEEHVAADELEPLPEEVSE